MPCEARPEDAGVSSAAAQSAVDCDACGVVDVGVAVGEVLGLGVGTVVAVEVPGGQRVGQSPWRCAGQASTGAPSSPVPHMSMAAVLFTIGSKMAL